uniref:MBOAT_2 domain-containing protein n=1 Tax=Macrostomum lignano TaxID=282301 RepID=A0A1I8FB55_9PLAT
AACWRCTRARTSRPWAGPVQLPGATKGIDYYIRPDVSKIDLFAWIVGLSCRCSTQRRPGSGAQLQQQAQASNCYGDTHHHRVQRLLQLPVRLCVCSPISATWPTSPTRSVEAVASDGPGLVFQVYPRWGRWHLPNFRSSWSCLFFFMLINLGVDSFVSRRHVRLEYAEQLRPGAVYDLHSPSADAVAIAWLYGLDEFCSDIKNAIGISPGIFWRITWKIISPRCIIVATIYTSFDTTSYLYFYAYSMYHPELFPNRTSGRRLFVLLFGFGQSDRLTRRISPSVGRSTRPSTSGATAGPGPSWRHWLSLGPTNVFPCGSSAAKLPVTDLTGQQSVDGEGRRVAVTPATSGSADENGGYIGSEASGCTEAADIRP